MFPQETPLSIWKVKGSGSGVELETHVHALSVLEASAKFGILWARQFPTCDLVRIHSVEKQ